jgi:hypothetical protein
LGCWLVLFLKMPFELVLGCFYGVLFAHTEFVVLARAQLWLSPIATRTPGLRRASAVRIPGEITSLALALRHLNFLSPAFAFLEPGARIGGDRATPQPVACSRAGVSLGLSHSEYVWSLVAWSLLFCQRPSQWSAATFGVPMTNNKGPLGTLGMGIPCGAA